MTRAVILEDIDSNAVAKLLGSPAVPGLPAHGSLTKGVINIEPGTIIKATAVDRFILTVAYPAMKADVGRAKDGFQDFADAEAVEKACWEFMEGGCKVGLWHEKGHEDCGVVKENSIYRGPDWEAAPGHIVKAGDWLVGTKLSAYAWEMYEKGLIGGSSPQGPCAREMNPSAELLGMLR
jgi:hypothetical protein